MEDLNWIAFNELKKLLSQKMREHYPEMKVSIEEWKGQEIFDFQEMLRSTVKGSISEKWFYTHIKNSQQGKIPRIDVLNMLCEFVGFRSWAAFVLHVQNQFSPQIPNTEIPIPENPAVENSLEENSNSENFANPNVANKETINPQIEQEVVQVEKEKKKQNKTLWFLFIIPILGLIYWLVSKDKPAAQAYHYKICFPDCTEKVNLELLSGSETPYQIKTDSNNCAQIEWHQANIKIKVSAPYHFPDTILRTLKVGTNIEEFSLKPDDYAMMLHYFSTNKVKEWKKRREKLQKTISDSVQIFWVNRELQAVDMLSKEEFIDLLTTPTNQLKKLEIIETQYNENRIMTFIKFKIL